MCLWNLKKSHTRCEAGPESRGSFSKEDSRVARQWQASRCIGRLFDKAAAKPSNSFKGLLYSVSARGILFIKELHMKMKQKLSVLAGALAFAAAGQAFATTSDLFLTVDDTTTQQFYTRDLGINMSTFLSDISGSGSTLAAASAGNMSFAADANLTSFLSAVGLGNNVIWNVTAAEVGAASPNAEAVMATSTATSLPSSQSNATLVNATGNLTTYYSGSLAYQANGLTSGSTAETPTLVSLGETASGYLKISTINTIGSSMNMFYITPSSTTNAKASGVLFGGLTTPDVWTLGSNGTLTVASTIAAVPEASEWMLMLSGFGLIGFIASRRKSSGGALTFA